MSMTIGEVLLRLRKFDGDKNVWFEFCRVAPAKVGSWRGIYAEPALGWDEEASITVKELIAELEEAVSGKVYEGYKGGDFSYTLGNQLHVDNYGQYTCTEIVGLECDQSEVTIYTKREE